MNILKVNGKMVKFVFVWDPSEADYERDFNVKNLFRGKGNTGRVQGK